MTVEGMTIINTQTWALILLCNKSTWPTPWARTFFDDVPFKHIMDTFIDDSFSSRVGSVRARSIRRMSGGKGNVASAGLQRPSSDIDKAKTGRYRALKSRTEAFRSAVSLVLVNALDKGHSSSDLY